MIPMVSYDYGYIQKDKKKTKKFKITAQGLATVGDGELGWYDRVVQFKYRMQ